MRQYDLMMNFERLRKEGGRERRKTGKQRQKLLGFVEPSFV